MNNMVEYIFNYINYTYSMVLELKDKNYCFKLAKEIYEKHPNTKFDLGKYDFYINEYIRLKLKNSESFIEYSGIKNHVYMSLIYYKTVNNVDIKDMDLLLNAIVKRIAEIYSYEDIVTNKCDVEIEKLIENRDIVLSVLKYREDTFISNRYTDEAYAKECILDFLIKYKDAYECNCSYMELAEKIYNSMIYIGINPADILFNKHNDYIISCIVNNKFGIALSKEFNDMMSELIKYVNSHTRKIKNKNIIKYDIYKTAMFLIREGYTYKDINYGIINDIIDESMFYGSIKINSMISDELSDSTPINMKHAIMPETARNRIFFETIRLMSDAFSTKISDDVFSEPPIIKCLDDYKYPNIPYELSEEFISAYDNVMRVYDKYIKYGNKYGQLCLLKVYESFASEKYHGMDAFLSFIKSKNSDILNNYTCYFEYVYNNLIEAGISNVYGTSYLRAVRSYTDAYLKNKNMHIFDIISVEDKKTLIKMMKDYERYCRKLSYSLFKLIDKKLL